MPLPLAPIQLGCNAAIEAGEVSIMSQTSRPPQDDLTLCISALESVRLVSSYYASGPDAARLIREVITMLGGIENPKGYSTLPVKMAIARAIHQAYLGDLPPGLGDIPKP